MLECHLHVNQCPNYHSKNAHVEDKHTNIVFVSFQVLRVIEVVEHS